MPHYQRKLYFLTFFLESIHVNTLSVLNSINSFFGVDSKIEVTDKGSSNSIMFLLATTGFPTAILLMYMFFKQQIIFKKKNKQVWISYNS